jgi:hypothetical protein
MGRYDKGKYAPLALELSGGDIFIRRLVPCGHDDGDRILEGVGVRRLFIPQVISL